MHAGEHIIMCVVVVPVTCDNRYIVVESAIIKNNKYSIIIINVKNVI